MEKMYTFTVKKFSNSNVEYYEIVGPNNQSFSFSIDVNPEGVCLILKTVFESGRQHNMSEIRSALGIK